MPDHSETVRALSQITDAGLFERLATAVLRQAVPALYGNLTHPGMNVDGKTVRSPVDGIAFVRGEYPPHMVAAHHASGASKDLRNKWLHDPSKVKPRKNRATATAPPGDVTKTMSIVETERNRTPGLRVTLALTTNREPPEELTRDVVAEASRLGITIDIWSCSRIAHHLDNDPDGQWLRKRFLGIHQTRLSMQLLHELSQASVAAFPLMARAEGLIDRELDRAIGDGSPRPVAFLVGDSGLGKTISCYKHLKTHIEAGGCGLVLTQESLAANRTLDQALDAELRKLCSSLEPDAGTRARALCSPDNPLFIIVEDVNRSDQPALLLERLAAWAQGRPTESLGERSDWRLVCPLWPKTLVSITSEEARKRIDALSVLASSFTSDEARAAVQRRAALCGAALSPLEADNLGGALGNDPLLIALYDFDRKPEPRQVISNFITSSLQRLAATSTHFTLTEYRGALMALGRKMLLHRRIDPAWVEIQEWLGSRADELSAMRHIVHDGGVLRLVDVGQSERIAFRHDRVRGWLLSNAANELMHGGQQYDSVLSEPFFADVIGTALADPNVPAAAIAQVSASNPLAMFFALKEFREPIADVHHLTLHAIETWLGAEETHSRANRSLRWAALQVLAETDSSHVLAITDLFNDQTWAAILARLRNGDVSAGVQLCRRIEPGATAPWRDRQIAHARIRFGSALIEKLSELLKGPDLDNGSRTGALRLAGHLAEPALADAVAACWSADTSRAERLGDYLWAAAECCGDDPERFLGPICDAWAALPDQAPQNGARSPRSGLAADHISWAFNEALPASALRFFIERSKQQDLHWPITYMLRGIDHPDAVEFIAREFAAHRRSSEGTGGFSPFSLVARDHWARREREKGRRMSSSSRQRVQDLWVNSDNDRHLRKEVFLLWSATVEQGDVPMLQAVEDPGPLADDILRARLGRGDSSAIPLLLEKIKNDDQGYWWQMGQSIWSDKLTSALEGVFKHRATTVKRSWGASYPSDWITPDLVMRLKPAEAERILSTHWDHLRFSPQFVQAALYVATAALRALVQETISECPDRSEMFKYIDQHFGIKQFGHPGVTRADQVEALLPYLDHFDPLAIHTFWELCNERGWIDLRRAHFDMRLQGKWRALALLDEAQFFADLDEELARNHIGWAHIWLDRCLGQGNRLDDIFNVLGRWLRQRRTIPALEFTAATIAHAGKRVDVDLLRVNGMEPAEQVEAIITDTRFAVSHRSLV